MTPPSLMSAQSPVSDVSPRAHNSSVAVTYPAQHHAPPTPSEAHILASMSRDAGVMEFVQPQYTQPAVPRSVKFELVEDSHQYRARIPMRVQIYPHDTTESIISTVKNFYGLYPTPTSCPGVSFEDEQGNTIIGRYENFRHNSVVYVRVRDGPPTPGPHASSVANGSAAQSFYAQDGYPVHGPPQQGHHMSRPGSRASRRRSISPGSVNGHRSASASTSSKTARSRSSKNRGPGSQSNGDNLNDSMNGYSSGDNAPGSSSGKPKEQIGSTEISLDNIVEGGRRKRAKFESSELPLFAPPQMPAAISNPSVSPARRMEHNRASLPFVQPGQNPFTNPRMILQSPQSHNNGYNGMGIYPTPATIARPPRGTAGYAAGMGVGSSMGILATPDPTVGSCMSEEDKDVAMQLMRLGDISNISHGRTSASTLDDTFSRNADAASSTGATSDGESESEADEKPPVRKQKLDTSDANKKIYPTTETHFSPAHANFEPSDDEDGYSDSPPDGSMSAPKLKATKTANGTKARSQSNSTKSKTIKAPKSIKSATGAKVKKSGSIPNGPMSPTSLPASRKPSIVSNPGATALPGEEDQPDLSTKPRCQRCRKSKKGCDRQRPCGRCRDAGIPAELCISEDEGNGRKGRYGRHMGVPVKKEEVPALGNLLLPPAPIATAPAAFSAAVLMDKNKKRKR